MEKLKIDENIRQKLRADFPKEAYKQHPTKTFLTTLKAMYVTERLNDIFGVGRWAIETEIIERTDNYILLQGEFKCLDFEVILPKQFGGHSTTGTNVEIADGYKSALTDCQSKIASYLEIGIDMFKGLIVVDKEPEGTTESLGNRESIQIKELSDSEIEKWNGRIYSKDVVYINGVKHRVSDEQLAELKAHAKYQPEKK